MDSLAYIEHVKDSDCVVYGCHNQVTAHHRKALGMGSKARRKQAKEHLSTIPICKYHHAEIHNIGEQKFSQKYGLNLDKESLRNLINWVWNAIQD